MSRRLPPNLTATHQVASLASALSFFLFKFFLSEIAAFNARVPPVIPVWCSQKIRYSYLFAPLRD